MKTYFPTEQNRRSLWDFNIAVAEGQQPWLYPVSWNTKPWGGKKKKNWGTIRLQFQHCTRVKLRITATPLIPLHAQPGQWEVQAQRVYATDTVTHKSGPRASWVPIWQRGGYRSVFHLPKLDNSAKARAAWLGPAILHSSTYQLELSNH